MNDIDNVQTVAEFQRIFPPNPRRHGRFLSLHVNGEKQAITCDGQPVTPEMIERHLGASDTFNTWGLGYLPGQENGTPCGLIDLDDKDFPGEEMDTARNAVLSACRALDLTVYSERSSRGHGWHLWLFTDALLLYGQMRDALRAILQHAAIKAEVYPMGETAASRWVITPYHHALLDPRRLGRTWLVLDNGQPIPVDKLAEYITFNPAERLQALAMRGLPQTQAAIVKQGNQTINGEGSELGPSAVPRLLEMAAQRAPLGGRHDALAAFLNLGQRAGDLEGMAEGLKSKEVLSIWCPDGSRTLQNWSDEINRWVENLRTGQGGQRRGLTYLRDVAGYTLPSLPEAYEPWPDLAPLPARLPEVPTLPPEMVPEQLRSWLLDVADFNCIPLEYVVTPAVVGLSGMIGRSVVIKPERLIDWMVTPNLWGGIVGRPGMMKSLAVSGALSPLTRLEARAAETYEQARRDAEIETELLQAARAQLKGKKGAGLTREALQDLKQRELDNKLTERRFLLQNISVEKLGELLRDNPRGLTFGRDELMSLIRDLSQEARAEALGFILAAWNGDEPYTFDRIGRGTVRIPHACVSIVGGVQPGLLADFVAQSRAGGKGDHGLLQRFQLFVYPDSLGKWERPTRPRDHNAKNVAFDVYEALDGLYDPEREGPPVLTFDTEAQQIWNDWRDELENRLRGHEFESAPAFESHLSKYRSLVPSLAAVFHLVQVATPELRADALGDVTAETLELALNWAAFLELHARKIYAHELGLSMIGAYALAEKIKAGRVKDGDGTRDLRRKDWADLSGQKFDTALEQLRSLGWVRIEDVPTGGAPREVLRLHPDLTRGQNEHFSDEELPQQTGRYACLTASTAGSPPTDPSGGHGGGRRRGTDNYGPREPHKRWWEEARENLQDALSPHCQDRRKESTDAFWQSWQ